MATLDFAPAPAADASFENTCGYPVRYIGRQPIFDLQQSIFGYELLFSTGPLASATRDSGEETRKMVDNVLLLGRQTLAGNTRVFVNFTSEALLDRLTTLLPADSTVVQILNTTAVDDSIVDACGELKQLGYRIALDSFQPGTPTDRLLPFADYIRIDLRASTLAELAATRKHLEGVPAALLAEKVATEEEFRRASGEGYTLFQGYFFARPTIVQSRVVPPNQIVYLQLLTEISKAEPDPRQVERLVTSETSLCFRVLRAVNSAAMGSRSEVTSIRHALLLLGQDHFRKMITLAIASGIDGRFTVPAELILLGLHRARFCELTANYIHQSPGEQYLLGLVSVVDAILRIPMEDVMAMLPLRKEAQKALLGHPEPSATSLRLIEAFERKDWNTVLKASQDLRLAEPILSDIYVASLAWAIEELRKAGI